MVHHTLGVSKAYLNTFLQKASAFPDGKNILYMAINCPCLSFPEGQSCMKPSCHSRIVSSSYLEQSLGDGTIASAGHTLSEGQTHLVLFCRNSMSSWVSSLLLWQPMGRVWNESLIEAGPGGNPVNGKQQTSLTLLLQSFVRGLE